MDRQTIDRIEKKYLITRTDKTNLVRIIRKNLQKDHYFHSKVMNIYFDTDNYDLIQQSIDQPIFKEKLRARSYAGYDRVFLEIKTKLVGAEANFGYKRRVMITCKDFQDFLQQRVTLAKLSQRSVETANDLQIAREVDYLVQYFKLTPKIMVLYDRESYKDNDDGLRITFDENLKYRTQNLSFLKVKRDKMYFKTEPNIIMEIKAHGHLPLWLTNALSARHLYPQQFSKVGKIYEKIRKEKYV